VATRI
jgi:fatty acyl-CoA reductase